MRNRNLLVARDADVISIYRLDHPKCVSEFICELKDGIDKGYDNFELDFSKVDSVYPNAIVPIAGIIEHFSNSGIEFELNQRTAPSRVATTRIMSPLRLPENASILEKNALNKVWRFSGSGDVAAIVDAYMNELRKAETFEKGIRHAIEWSINETMDNVIQHAQIDHGYIMGQLHSSNKYVVFTIFDLGQGVLSSLRESVHHPKTTIDALTLCIQEGVTSGSGMGNGLFGLYSIVKQGNGRMVLTSGNGSYMYEKGTINTFERIPFVSHENKGTTIDFQLNYASGLSLEKALVFRGKPYEMVDLFIEGLEDERGSIIYKILEHSEGTGTREAAKRVRNELLNIIKESGKIVVLDFEGVSISSSFADELIAKLFMEMGLFQFNNAIRIKNMDQSMQLILQRSVMQRIIEEFK